MLGTLGKRDRQATAEHPDWTERERLASQLKSREIIVRAIAAGVGVTALLMFIAMRMR